MARNVLVCYPAQRHIKTELAPSTTGTKPLLMHGHARKEPLRVISVQCICFAALRCQQMRKTLLVRMNRQQ